MSEDADASNPSLQAVLHDLRGQRQLEQSIEAMLVSTRVPMTTAEIAEALGYAVAPVEEALERLRSDLEGRALGLFHRDKQGQKAWILDIRAAYRADVASVAPPLLKPAVTETLALIAINQPIPQARLVRERGSTVYDHVKELVARGLVQRGKQGRSYVLGTTDAFAAEFGLANDPGLIRRALAKAAGVEGAPEVIGSPRIHFDETAKQTAPALQAEAQEIADEQAAQAQALSDERAARLQAALAEVEAEQQQAEAEQPAEAAETDEGSRSFQRDLSPGLAAGRGPVSRLPSDAFEPMPVEDDAVVSGGEAPTDQRETFTEQESSMAPSNRPDHETTPEENTSESSRLARLLAMTGDDDTTNDDW